MNKILDYLKKHGESHDTQIAEATGLTLGETRVLLAELDARNEIMTCHSTRYEKGEKIEGMNCRIAGYIVRAKPGAKPKVNLKL